jgi:hypothetical protein
MDISRSVLPKCGKNALIKRTQTKLRKLDLSEITRFHFEVLELSVRLVILTADSDVFRTAGGENSTSTVLVDVPLRSGI